MLFSHGIKIMKKNFVIRRAKIEDLGDILRLNFALFEKEHNDYAPDLNLKWTYGKGKKIFAENIQNKDNFAVVAEINNKIIGYLCGSLCKLSWRGGAGRRIGQYVC